MMKMVMKVNLRLQNAEWNSALEKVSVTGATITLSWVWLKNWANKLHFMYSLCWGNQRAEAECQVQKTDGFSIQFRRENCWCHYKWQGLNSSGVCGGRLSYTRHASVAVSHGAPLSVHLEFAAPHTRGLATSLLKDVSLLCCFWSRFILKELLPTCPMVFVFCLVCDP